jgi:hypothetical protein
MERLEKLQNLPPIYQYYLSNPETLPLSNYDIFGSEYTPQIQSDEDMLDFINRYEIEYVIETDYCGGSTPYRQVSSLTFPTVTETVRSQLDLIYTISPFADNDCKQHIENRTHMEYMRLWDWERVGPIIRVYRVQESD